MLFALFVSVYEIFCRFSFELSNIFTILIKNFFVVESVVVCVVKWGRFNSFVI